GRAMERDGQIRLSEGKGIRTGAGAGTSNASEPAPFELPPLAGTWQGAVAFRPAAMFGRPDMKAITEEINKFMQSEEAKFLGLGPRCNIHIEDIEQVIGRLVIQTNKRTGQPGAKTGEGQTALLINLTM